MKDPTAEDFLEWAINNKEAFIEFYEDGILDLLLDYEQNDYFGTEGFDKRL